MYAKEQEEMALREYERQESVATASRASCTVRAPEW